jgi:spermidine dehydrogenase
MTIDGKQILINGGTMEIYDLNSFTAQGKQLIADIGIVPERFKAAEEVEKDQFAKLGMRSACFFDKETFGVDRLVRGMPGFVGFASAAPGLTQEEFLAQAPFTASVRASLLKIRSNKIDHFPGLSRAEKIAKLKKMSYQSYLLDVMKLDPKIIDYLYRMDTHGVNGAFGADTYSAWTAFRKTRGGPGPFDGLDLGPVPSAGWNEGEQMHIHLPDGNGGVARLLVRWLIPEALPGKSMEDSIAPAVNYAVLDQARNDVRIRLKSTVVNVRHDGDPAVASETIVTYMTDGKAHHVRSANTVMACFNAMVPYICKELPQAQQDALHMSVRMPIVYTNVALRNWRAFEKLGVSNIYFPGGMHSHICLDPGTSLGAYKRSPTPDDPIFVNMWMTPMDPNSGLSARDQFRMGRQKLLDTSFAQFEASVRSQLSKALKGSGFDAEKDILGIFVNRWGHGYAGCANDLFDPDWTREEAPWVVGRKRFGRIAIANSDAGAICLTQAAFDQAHRAVTEIITDNVRPSFGFPWGERN